MNLKLYFFNFYLSVSETVSFPTCCVFVCVCAHFPASFGWNKNHAIQQTFPLRVEIFFIRCWLMVTILLGANAHSTGFQLLTSYWLDPGFCSTPYRWWHFLLATASLALGSTYTACHVEYIRVQMEALRFRRKINLLCPKVWSLHAAWPLSQKLVCFEELMPLTLPLLFSTTTSKGKGKTVPLQAWSGPEGSRKLRFPDFITTAQDGGKVVSLTHRPSFPPGNAPGIHFCWRLSRPQGHSAIGRILFNEKFQWHQLGSNKRPSDL